MRILEKTARVAAIVLAVLVIGLGLCGVVGAWFVDRQATDVALKGFGVLETGVGVVDAGVGRVNDLVTTSRTEVRQAAETIGTVGAKAQANSPVLKALNERLETNLAPRVAQMQQVLAPVRDALGAVGNALGMLNSLPSWPIGLAAGGVGGDLQPPGRADRRHDATARDAAGPGGAERQRRRRDRRRAPGDHAAHRHPAGRSADERSAVRPTSRPLQVRLGKRKSRLLFVFNLLAMLATLMMAWVIYSQVVVIQHHRGRMRQPVA